ncbi:MAG: GTP-binding protein [Flavobacteriaceae bacterium]
MDVLKIATAGSVDDGKSTLIGRLLYDTKSLTEDKLEAIERASQQKGFDYLDFSFATDGLVAEREQGITIDVAHIYFSTPKRSYIIADTPGHIEYTRNLVTGASTSQVAIVLIDVRKGITEQTHRHFFINNLLRVKKVIVAINKMDLVDYCQKEYQAIQSDFESLIQKRNHLEQDITFIPVSALKGDNIVDPSHKMTWYSGPPLLSHLEGLNPSDVYHSGKPRFPIQYVIRAKKDGFHNFRGYAGKVYGGDFHVGEKIKVLPSKTQSKIKEIYMYDQLLDTASRGCSVALTLEDEINVSRGDMIIKASDLPTINSEFTATICWMDTTPLTPGNQYILQHGVKRVQAKVNCIHHKIRPDYSGIEDTVRLLGVNDIASVSFQLNTSIFYDSYQSNRTNGAFILIDSKSNNTVGTGFID